ncbi:MAG TPA: S-adenosylmethionine:tRNA ribosyltransferase-isomerase [Acidimicrobiales bacterium]|nr:S-adenosylmethionine:tRNA ribosyltransferase-isomerase [Acidimicrobiales bacterium]
MTVLERATSFVLPPELEAGTPPERRVGARDRVRLMVARPGRIEHRQFTDIEAELDPGDVVVINTSATLPAALAVTGPDGLPFRLHVSGRVPVGGLWLVEVRRPAGAASLAAPADRQGQRLALPAAASAELISPATAGSRLWVARIRGLDGGLAAYLQGHGFPIRYPYVDKPWPLSDYQTVYATEPGSAEMASAGRPFTTRLLTSLVAKGVEVAPLLLHTGVSSLEDHEPPYPEWFRVPPATARRVNAARRAGARVVAVGTTVVRALESAADDEGVVHPAEGWTDLVIGPGRPVRVVGGLLTGWHQPGSSHLAMLTAVGGPELVQESYAEALSRRYLWHEFGDVHLLLP